MFKSLIFVVLVCTAAFARQSFEPRNGKDVLMQMYDTYRGKWYSDLTFKQQSQFFKDGTMTREETWYEALKAGRGLVIKFGAKESGSGIVFEHDSMFVFRNDTLTQSTRRVHDLLVLGFDVYVDEPARTFKRLEEAGYNLDSCAIEKHGSETVFVVGDGQHGRFWISEKTFLFLKMTTKDPRGNTIEVQFNKYVPVGGGFIAPEVVMLRNGQMVMKETYSGWSISAPLPASVFDRSSFKQTTW